MIVNAKLNCYNNSSFYTKPSKAKTIVLKVTQKLIDLVNILEYTKYSICLLNTLIIPIGPAIQRYLS